MKITEAVFNSHGWDSEGAAPRPAAGGDRLPALRAEGRDGRHPLPARARREQLQRPFEGVVTNLERRYRETDSEYIKTELEKYMVERPCPTCKRQAPAARGARRDDRRPGHLRRRRPLDHRRAGVGADAPGRDLRARAGDRLPGAQGDHGAPRASWSTSGSTT